MTWAQWKSVVTVNCLVTFFKTSFMSSTGEKRHSYTGLEQLNDDRILIFGLTITLTKWPIKGCADCSGSYYY